MTNTTSTPTYACPLTLVPPRDPVIDPDGHTYERDAIEHWIRQNGISPMTREPLTIEQLVPNRALLDQMTGAVTGSATVAANDDDDDDTYDVDNGALDRAVEHLTLANKSVTAQVHSLKTDDGEFLTVSVTPQDTNMRGGVDVVAVIDLSASMTNGAKLKTADDSGSAEDEQFLTILQLVKHAVGTCIVGLKPIDRLALVSFSVDAKLELELTFMDSAGKRLAKNILKNLKDKATTNIWGGLQMALDLLKNNQSKNSQHIMLFTDGVPNINPPRGNIPTLVRYLEKAGKDARAVIHTFGFGYSLDSILLAKIAEIGGGSFGFIPDATFVGTIFINALANILANMARNATVYLKFKNNKATNVKPINTRISVQLQDRVLSANFGLVHLGQQRNVTFKGYKNFVQDIESYEVIYEYGNGETSIIKPATDAIFDESETSNLIVMTDIVRASAIDLTCKCLDMEKPLRDNQPRHSAEQPIPAMPAKYNREIPIVVKLAESIDSNVVEDLLVDFTGEIKMGFEHANYITWGAAFNRSITRAHELQIATNFKDPGLQHYGGSLFKMLQEELEDAFLKVPAPKPTIKKKDQYGRTSYVQSAVPSNMSSYYNSGGVCFSGENLVAMANGSRKRVDEIRKGDRVKTSKGDSAVVTCVVESLQTGAGTHMIEIGSLIVTPYHPIISPSSGEWCFPKDVANAVSVVLPLQSVFSFALDGQHTMVIEDIKCICLAHGMTDNDVVAHPFFGTRAVLDALPERQREIGHVVLPPNALVRTADERNLVCGFRTFEYATSSCATDENNIDTNKNTMLQAC